MDFVVVFVFVCFGLCLFAFSVSWSLRLLCSLHIIPTHLQLLTVSGHLCFSLHVGPQLFRTLASCRLYNRTVFEHCAFNDLSCWQTSAVSLCRQWIVMNKTKKEVVMGVQEGVKMMHLYFIYTWGWEAP